MGPRDDKLGCQPCIDPLGGVHGLIPSLPELCSGFGSCEQAGRTDGEKVRQHSCAGEHGSAPCDSGDYPGYGMAPLEFARHLLHVWSASQRTRVDRSFCALYLPHHPQPVWSILCFNPVQLMWAPEQREPNSFLSGSSQYKPDLQEAFMGKLTM